MLKEACLVTVLMLFNLFLARIVGQYAGSATDFRARFRILKSDTKTKKDRCGTARQFNNVMLTWKVSYVKERINGNVSFSLVHMV